MTTSRSQPARRLALVSLACVGFALVGCGSNETDADSDGGASDISLSADDCTRAPESMGAQFLSKLHRTDGYYAFTSEWVLDDGDLTFYAAYVIVRDPDGGYDYDTATSPIAAFVVKNDTIYAANSWAVYNVQDGTQMAFGVPLEISSDDPRVQLIEKCVEDD